MTRVEISRLISLTFDAKQKNQTHQHTNRSQRIRTTSNKSALRLSANVRCNKRLTHSGASEPRATRVHRPAQQTTTNPLEKRNPRDKKMRRETLIITPVGKRHCQLGRRYPQKSPHPQKNIAPMLSDKSGLHVAESGNV
ncbi:hypothetical protein VTL71DRAFT_6378 [Oculimacula yallundae]|uniref:Uncharacterized protein n=1 Tax=Oculimacula yallundae TaxID=86028 RepID=A0ABR4BXI6_9HELO